MLSDRGAVAKRCRARTAQRLEPWCERLDERRELGVARVPVGGDHARRYRLGFQRGVSLRRGRIGRRPGLGLERPEDVGQLGDEGADGLAEEAAAGPRPSPSVRHVSLESDPS